MNLEPIPPFLKWAGGKRWLVNRFPELFPERFNRYYEPFLGSASVFFALRPRFGQLSDKNPELINLFKAMKNSPEAVRAALRRYAQNHSNDYYYEVRSRNPKTSVGRAARTLYLNRTCWNGLYRVNQRGEFNVPRGTKDAVLFSDESFTEIARSLSRIAIKCCDFATAISSTKKNDFLFLDPPYTVKHNNNGFIKYNESIFTWADQLRLFEVVKLAKKRGVKILLTNADHKPIRDMYAKLGNLHTLPRKSIISGNSDGRSKTSELAVQINYESDYRD